MVVRTESVNVGSAARVLCIILVGDGDSSMTFLTVSFFLFPFWFLSFSMRTTRKGSDPTNTGLT